MNIELDPIDLKIIELLKQDSRLSHKEIRQRENEEKARKPPGIERNTQPDSAARRGPKGHLRFGKAAGQIREPVSGAVLDDRMTLYLRMGKSHRQGSAAGSDKNENK
jgi:hypothetical protein